MTVASEAAPEARTLTYRDAMREAIREALQRDPRVFLMGEDVGHYGGCYAVSKGLLAEFGEERIRDTPLSEGTFTGAGIGAAIALAGRWLADEESRLLFCRHPNAPLAEVLQNLERLSRRSLEALVHLAALRPRVRSRAKLLFGRRA